MFLFITILKLFVCYFVYFMKTNSFVKIISTIQNNLLLTTPLLVFMWIFFILYFPTLSL